MHTTSTTSTEASSSGVAIADNVPHKVLMKGNEAIAEGAILGGCDAYFGYPITPQSEILEYMSSRMPQLGKVFIQAESETAAINMVLGAAATGGRAMTSSSGPGISLKQEGISFLCACELPAVIVNVMRAGPGLGGILPGQADYFQATRGGGHGDYRLLVLAPDSVQEAMDFTAQAFNLADTYRNPVMILADGLIGQIMEPVEIREYPITRPPKPWALTGAHGRPKNSIRSLYLTPEPLEDLNLRLGDKYRRMEANEIRYEGYMLDDAEVVMVAYGSSARVAHSAVRMARQQGLKAGLFRPITLFPFPYQALSEVAEKTAGVLVIEMSYGQLVEDVRIAIGNHIPIQLYSRMGGMLPVVSEAVKALHQLAGR